MDFQKQLEEANAEKVALDQLYVESLKNQILLRKQLILKESEVNKLNIELANLKSKAAEKELSDLVSEK